MIEAGRFNAAFAVLIVHSFSQSDEWFSEFQDSTSLYGQYPGIGQPIQFFQSRDVEVMVGGLEAIPNSWMSNNSQEATRGGARSPLRVVSWGAGFAPGGSKPGALACPACLYLAPVHLCVCTGGRAAKGSQS